MVGFFVVYFCFLKNSMTEPGGQEWIIEWECDTAKEWQWNAAPVISPVLYVSLILIWWQVRGESAGGEEDKGGGRGRGRTFTRWGWGSQYGAGAILTGIHPTPSHIWRKRTFLVIFDSHHSVILFLRTSKSKKNSAIWSSSLYSFLTLLVDYLKNRI